MDGWMDGKLRWNFSAPSLSLRWAEPRQIRSIRSGPFLAVWNCSAPTGSLPYVPFSQNFGRFGFFSAALLCRSVGEWDGEYYAGRRIWVAGTHLVPGSRRGCVWERQRAVVVGGWCLSFFSCTDRLCFRPSLAFPCPFAPGPLAGFGPEMLRTKPTRHPCPRPCLGLTKSSRFFWTTLVRLLDAMQCCGPGERQELFGSRGWLIRGCVWRCVWCVCVCA